MDPVQQVRNIGFMKEDYENVFLKYLGVTNTIWLAKVLRVMTHTVMWTTFAGLLTGIQ